MAIKEYDLIFSIGSACSCTSALRAGGLQKYSFPFDWLYGGNITDRCRILASKFERFIDKQDLQYSHPMKQIKGSAYRNTFNKIVFNHDFSSDPLDQIYDAVRYKYDRRINRLLNLIEQKERILMVFMETPDEALVASDEELLCAQKEVSAAFGKKIELLYIYNSKVKSCTYISSEVCKISRSYNSTSPGALAYEVDEKVVGQIFKEYSLKETKEIKKEYDLFFSLGGSCAVSTQLRRRGLQRFSLPFDWLFFPLEGQMAVVKNIFEKSFAGWLSKENLVELKGEERGTSENFQYKDISTGFRFIHDFHLPLENEQEYFRVKERYQRRIERLRFFTKHSKRILMVTDLRFDFDMKQASDFLKYLKSVYPKKEFELVCVRFQAQEDGVVKEGPVTLYNYKRGYEPADYWGRNSAWEFLDTVKLPSLSLVKLYASYIKRKKLFFKGGAE